MGRCVNCGKKGLFLRLSWRHLCNECEAQRAREERERKREEEAAKIMAEYESSKAFETACTAYRDALAGENAEAIPEVEVAMAACDAFRPALNAFLASPNATDILAKHFEGQSIVYKLPDLGYVDIKRMGGDQVKVSFDSQVERVERLRREYAETIENTAVFREKKAALQFVPVTLTEGAEPQHSDVLLPIQGKNITQSTPVSRLSNFMVIDTETTGLSPTENEIVQLTAINFVNLVPTRAFSTYVRPRGEMGEKAMQINGITPDMVKDAPYIEQVLPSFSEFIGTKVPLVGHNISFDLNFLQASGLPATAYYRRTVYDTLDLSKKVYASPSNKLTYLCRHTLHVIRDDAHDAVSDALATGELFLTICRRRIGEL